MCYVALSYVWATAAVDCSLVQCADGTKKLPQHLPQVIQDSIEVTRALGHQYLWVDKFCIAQDSPELKHYQILQMDAIYQNANLTIVSAAGTYESHDLPRVSSAQRTPQNATRSRDVTAMWYPADPHSTIVKSNWSTRGWTFQEAVLSRRRLVFTDDQTYFEFGTMSCLESIQYPLKELETWDNYEIKILFKRRRGLFGKDRTR